jgi:hypothetical protein
MNIDRIRASRRFPTQSSFEVGEDSSETQLPVSRRQFVRTSASAVVAGAAQHLTLRRPSWLRAGSDPAHSAARPVRGGFHVRLVRPTDADRHRLHGFVGLAYISGTVTRRKKSTGAVDASFPGPTCASCTASIVDKTGAWRGAFASYELTSARPVRATRRSSPTSIPASLPADCSGRWRSRSMRSASGWARGAR